MTMARTFAISPDVNARNVTDWFVFNTRLQRITGESIRATAYDDFADLHAAYREGQADFVLANAADTTTLVRDLGYRPIAVARGISNEAVVVVSATSPVQELLDLRPPLTVAATDAPDVERICRILLEPADIGPQDITLALKRNGVLVAKAVITGEAQVGFLGSDAFESMSRVTRDMLRELIASRIYVVKHVLLAGPAVVDLRDQVWQGLAEMNDNPADRELLASLGAPDGWERFSDEEAEFLIDLVEALAQ